MVARLDSHFLYKIFIKSHSFKFKYGKKVSRQEFFNLIDVFQARNKINMRNLIN